MLKRTLFLMFLLASVGIHAQSFKEFMSEGERQYGRKKYKEAIIAYKKAMEINPDDAMLNFKLGLAYLYSDTKSKAATFIDKAYKLNPNIDNRIDYHLGIAFQNRNDFKRAIEHFQYFSRSNPHVAEIADKFKGADAADIYAYMRLHAELVLRAEDLLLARAGGAKPHVTEADRAGFARLHALERKIGKTALLAIWPHLHYSREELAELYELESRTRYHA